MASDLRNQYPAASSADFNCASFEPVRAFKSEAHVPAVLEPIGLARSDGKRPDGMTLIPWRLGRSLLWDATCVDTLAASHIQATSSMVGAAASSVEQAKRRKYENLDSSLIFVPFGVETLGPWGPEARALFKELSKRVIESTGDPRAGSYLGQRISLAIQRGNAASIFIDYKLITLFFNAYGEHIIRQMLSDGGVSIEGKKLTNLHYADDTFMTSASEAEISALQLWLETVSATMDR
ncbi:jg17482 [Pararge aegeria aegeria]|uniref:Jg17482 protein n=1 Tax=Pararge aegeria aegeria TaxID=348720 RepID=A0A8S4RQ93_9NEOP|nr:jg17482 [Pararge aegeria aegeria]